MKSTQVNKAFGLRNLIALQHSKPRRASILSFEGFQVLTSHGLDYDESGYLAALKPGAGGSGHRDEILSKLKAALREAGATDVASDPSSHAHSVRSSVLHFRCASTSTNVQRPSERTFTCKMTTRQLDQFLHDSRHKHFRASIVPFGTRVSDLLNPINLKMSSR